MIVIRTCFERFAVFMSCFLVCDIMTLNRNFYFERDDTFRDLLPITGNVNYIETKYYLSQIECGSRCVFCAGFLYNSATGTCHLLKTRLVERYFNRSRVDIGWELYNSLNVCSSGWHLYNTHCYTSVKINANWTEAKDYCDSIGAYLVRIETVEENEWITETLKKHETCSNCCVAWIGASDQVQEKVFKWTNNENVTFTNWKPGQPDNDKGMEDFVSMCFNGQWNDEPNSLRLNAICEKNMIAG